MEPFGREAVRGRRAGSDREIRALAAGLDAALPRQDAVTDRRRVRVQQHARHPGPLMA